MYLWKTRQLVTFGSVPKHSWLVHICFLGISAHLHIRARGCTQNSAHHTLRMSRPSAPGGGDLIIAQDLASPECGNGDPYFAHIWMQSALGFLWKTL